MDSGPSLFFFKTGGTSLKRFNDNIALPLESDYNRYEILELPIGEHGERPYF